MPGYDQNSAIATVAVNQLIVEWVYELDQNEGLSIKRMLTDDCAYHVGGTVFTGPEAVQQFYIARQDRVRAQQKDGIRTQRHTLSTVRIVLKDETHADVTYTIVNFSHEGKPPILGETAPTIIADCRMECRKEANGEWRIALFDSKPVFIGNDPFLNASVVKT